MIIIYAPEGSKGLLVDGVYNQHEWLLDKNQRFKVIHQDDEKKEVEIQLLKK